MPWKLVAFLSFILVVTAFIGFNLDNRCDVSLVFHVWRDVPVFVSLLVAYLCGALTVVPFFVAARFRRPSAGKGSRKTGGRSALKSSRPAKAMSEGDYDDLSGDYLRGASASALHGAGRGSARDRNADLDSSLGD
jgi:uncharacterized integral membrane protein